MTVDLELQIETLALEEVTPRDSELVRAAVESELTRLLVERGTPPTLARGRAVGYVNGGVVEIPSGAGGKTIGVRIAQAVYEGLCQ